MTDTIDVNVLSEMTNKRSHLQRILCEVQEERDKHISKLAEIRETKDKVRKQISAESRKEHQLKLDLIEIKAELKKEAELEKDRESRFAELDKDIFDKMRLARFEATMEEVNQRFQGAINFYNEDSLQIEYMTKHKCLSDRRVELTTIESEIRIVKEKIQRKEEERIRAEQAEKERQRLEAERDKIVEEERRRLELEQQREQYRQEQLKVQALATPTSELLSKPQRPFLESPAARDTKSTGFNFSQFDW